MPGRAGPGWSPCLTSPGTSFVRDHRFLGRRRSRLEWKGKMRIGGTAGGKGWRHSVSQCCARRNLAGIWRRRRRRRLRQLGGAAGVAMHSSCHWTQVRDTRTHTHRQSVRERWVNADWSTRRQLHKPSFIYVASLPAGDRASAGVKQRQDGTVQLTRYVTRQLELADDRNTRTTLWLSVADVQWQMTLAT